jgi:hypothetical protein
VGNEDHLPWPPAEEYGLRFREINEKLSRVFGLLEYRAETAEQLGVLQYRLAKLAIAAEDIRRAISVVEVGIVNDELMAQALVELRSACSEVIDSFKDADAHIIALMNYLEP